MEAKKISQLTETTTVTENCCMPIVSGNATKKVSFNTLSQNLKGDKGDKGEAGVGILTVEQTVKAVGDEADNIVRITTTDGAVRDIYVKNGSKGDKGDKGDTGDIASLDEIIRQAKPLLFEAMYPVGAIYITLDERDPSVILGVGQWERIATGKTLWGGDGTNTGAEVEAGLPNITGDTGGLSWENIAPVSGAFYRTNKKYGEANDGTVYVNGVALDASRSNAIYGASETVQPPALVVNMWKRIV